MSRNVDPTEDRRWHYFDGMPGLRPTIWGVVEASKIKPGLAEDMANAGLWLILYFHTPVRFSLRGHPSGWREMAARSAVLIAPGSRYSVDTRFVAGTSHHAWMNVDGLGSTPLFARLLGADNGHARFRDPSGLLGERLTQLVDLLQSLDEKEPFWATQLNGRKILDLMSTANLQKDGCFEIPASTSIPAPDPLVGRVVEYLHAHMTESVTLKQIATHVNASASTVSHRYRTFAGEPPIQTMKRMRILQAKIMMIRGQPLREIVESLNFCDARHLSIQFKRFDGMSPSQFLKQARGEYATAG